MKNKKFIWKALGVILLGLIVFNLGGFMGFWGVEERGKPWTPSLKRPILSAHRGGAGEFPENTLYAFRKATEKYGCTLVDLDVHATKDGVPVVIHDATVDRTTDGKGQVKDLTYAEIQGLDAGARFSQNGGFPFRGKGLRVPTLAEVLTAFSTCHFTLEIKQADPPIEKTVIATIRAVMENHPQGAGLDRRMILGAMNENVLDKIKALAPEIPRFYSFRGGAGLTLALWLGLGGLHKPTHHALFVPQRLGPFTLVTPGFIEGAHALGLPVIVWTVDEREKMRELIAMGADGIITNFPARFPAP